MNVVQDCVYKKLRFPASLPVEYLRNLLMLRISAAELDGELINKYLSLPFTSPHTSGLEQADKLSAGEISKDDYDRWRYYYPKYDTTQLWAKVPSQELSNTLVEVFQDKLKKDE